MGRHPGRAAVAAFVSSSCVLLSAGCGGDDPVCAAGAGRQPLHRFPSGSTFALPPIDAGASGCGAARWSLAAAPTANANQLVRGADGDRFTPTVPGTYAFEVTATGERLTLTVVDGTTVPFHHLNYYPGRSIGVVGDELWVANVYAPTITPIGADDVAGPPLVVGPWPVAVAWRPGMAHAVVAQRASDDLGIVDVAARRIVDAVPVGDEPADVVVSPDGRTAYVSLAVSGVVAVVDLDAREVVDRIALAPDLRALALSPDGATLYAARLRSGQPVRAPFPDTPVDDERDVFFVDTASRQITRELVDVGATLRALELSADGRTLYLVRLRNLTTGNIADGDAHFIDEVARIDTGTGELLNAADLGRQLTSTGAAVSLQGLVLDDGLAWVTAEGSDAVVAIDATTLAEVDRVAAAGRPRAVAVRDGRIYVHGPQGFVVTPVTRDGEAAPPIVTGADPRPADVARGQRIFTGAGKAYGADHGCNSCHAEGLTDRLVWKVGPVDEYATPRALFWLEGTYPLGWPAYLSDVRNWGYEGGSTTGVRPTTAEAEDLGAYLAALMPPPAANDWTTRDGGHTETGLRGKALFEGEAGCATCHRAPLFTSRRLYEEGVTPGPSDVPSLVGAYRHGVWLKDGSARTIDEAVGAVAAWLELELDATQRAELARYVQELTARDFFLLASAPRHGDQHVGVDRPIELTFSYPVWDDPENRARIRLVDGAGREVAVDAVVDGRHVTLSPVAPLDPAASYRVEIGAELEAFDEQRAWPASVELATAAAPGVVLEGAYRWRFDMPGFNPQTGEFDPSRPVPVEVPVVATRTASGAELVFDLGQGLSYARHAVIDGAELHLPALPVPVGPSLADARLDAGTLVDDDGDGVADRVTGTLLFTGPGFRFAEQPWSLARPPVGCAEGVTGAVEVEVEPTDDGGARITWSGRDDALALYVTAPDATIPMGPGQTVQGTAYWVIQTSAFPTGFPRPVVYGAVPDGATDATTAQGGTFAPLESGRCYKFTVTTDGFETGSRIVDWP